MGQELEVKILRVDVEDRKIGLSLKRVRWAEEDAQGEQAASAPAKQLRGGLHGPGDLGSDLISYSVLSDSGPAEQPPADEQPAAAQSQPVTPAEEQLEPEVSASEAAAESPQPSEPQDKPATDERDTADDAASDQPESSPAEAADDAAGEQKDESSPSPQ